ncbi:hypothetical protein LCGC14_2789500 [marine sediment metagenome]|uniref:Uncharacterized protein n=1 Tax=marine sediment metagenome TaxID=412755 RepID=A0A0F8YQY1_9ZZZZ
MMKESTYTKVEQHRITCKCGTVVVTSSVEYFCPRCNELLVRSVGGQQGHIVYDFADDVEYELKRKVKRNSVRERGKLFNTQAQLREYVLSKFKYLRGNIKKRYSLAHDGKVILRRMFGSAVGKIIIDDTDDNRIMARGVRI